MANIKNSMAKYRVNTVQTIQYTRWVWCKRQNIKFKISMSLSEKVLFNWASDMCHVTLDMWQLTFVTWHVKCDIWHTGVSEYCLDISGPLALTVWELSMMFWRYLNKRMHNCFKVFFLLRTLQLIDWICLGAKSSEMHNKVGS